MHFFNTAGPVNCKDHYCLPPLDRINLSEILSLIEQKKYFILHAPRQTGKTSCLLALMDYLNQEGTYKCLYINVESAQGAREDVYRGIRAILGEMSDRAAMFLHDDALENMCQEILTQKGEDIALNASISRWCAQNTKPIVLLIDEIDSLIGDTLISVLRQLRGGYDKRSSQLFPQSIVLCGLRDIRDYRIHSSKEKSIITGGSAFNIKAESLRIGDFSKEEIKNLYMCHTAETGQVFEQKTIDLVWEYSEGQPWIVNALAYEVCFKMEGGKDRSVVITSEMIENAIERIILRRETHIDQLVDKLSEERVKRVILPIILGVEEPETIPQDDISYVYDLGLIKKDRKIRIANRLYQEVIPRELTYSTQLTMSQETVWYIRKEDGLLDILKLLRAFQEFFREHSESWEERFQYKEAGPHLLMQAFLQRIINAGGRIDREYGLGKKRTDLLMVWKKGQQVQKVVIELKIRYHELEKTIEKGMEQTYEYMDKCGTTEGHLVIFDKSKTKTWDDKLFCRQEKFKDHIITVWGM